MNNIKHWCKIIFIVALYFIVNNTIYSQVKFKELKPIPILLSSNASFYIKSLNGLQSIFKNGVQLHYINYLTSDKQKLKFFKKIKKSNPRVIVTMGLTATNLASKYIKRIPIVFSLVPSLKSLNLKQKNLCGISENIDITEFFRVIKELKPASRNVVSFYKTREGSYLAGEGEYSDLKNHLLFSKYQVNDLRQLKEKLSTLQDIDAIIMIADSLYSRVVFNYLSNYSRKNNIILVSGYSSLIRLGATFGIVPDYTTLGIAKGNLLNKVLANPTICRNGKIQFLNRGRIHLNTRYALDSQITIPSSLLTRQRAEQLFEIGISLFQEKKYKSAKAVFTEIKRIRPKFNLAQKYLLKIDEILVSELSLDLFEKARKYVEQRNIRGAFIVMNEIRNKFRDSESAKLRLQNLKSLLSHKETEDAIKYLQQGKKFLAYRKLKSAIRFDKNNKLARKQYRTLLYRINKSIPFLIKKGKVYYNSRRYYQAENIFNDILLVQSRNKIATEYRRLSHQKRIAIQRLLNCNKSKKKGCTLSW